MALKDTQFNGLIEIYQRQKTKYIADIISYTFTRPIT